MTQPKPALPAPNPLREVRSLGQATAGADDAAVARIVGFLDGLVERGELDRILDPVRPRLRGLGTPRRLRFPRLLFLPLDGAIVSPSDWVRGEAKVPRSALRSLANAVQRAMGPRGTAIAEEVVQHTTHANALIGRLGDEVWPEAARLLPEAPPPGWEDSGLAARDYAPIAGLCRPLWAAGPALWTAMAAQGPPEGLAQAALEAVLPAGPEALAIALATLLRGATAPGQLLQTAASLHPQARKVAQEALDAVMEGPLPPFATLQPQQTAAAALALADRLDDMANCALLTSDRQKRLAACRHRAEAAFRASYLTTVQEHLLQPVERLGAAAQVQDAEVSAMEVAARQLRALEAAGRRLGGATHYDMATQRMTARIAALLPEAGQSAGLRRMDLARCIEILAGPEAAAAVMG